MSNFETFAALHRKGNPIVIFNAWDAGSAKAIAAAGAKVIGTSSWAVAAAQGYKDGENLPIDTFFQIAARIVAAVDVPVSIDFEGGYADDDAQLADNVRRLVATGAIGINFEDRVVKGEGLYAIDRQARRIEAIRKAAPDLFINARTDVFFQGGTSDATVAAALERARAYAAAGASGFFVPALVDETFIAKICEHSPLPVNAMMLDKAPAPARLAQLGVSRISYGTIPYAFAMKALQEHASRTIQY